MCKKCSLIVIVLALLLALPAAAQDDNPTVAILRFGDLPSIERTEGAILDLLQSYGFISAEENRILEERRDYQGEHINIIWGEAGFDLPTVSIMVDSALDQEPDVLVTLSTPVTLVAVNSTLDMDEPTPVLFTSVHSPYEAGIGKAACIKPAHVTGTEIETSYEYVIDALQMQNPDIAAIGTIYDTAAASGVYGAGRIASIGAERGLAVDEAGVTTLADLRAAAASLAEKGAEAIVLPVDTVTTQGLPIITAIANENSIPVFHPSMGAIYYGATIGAGYSQYYENGVHVGRLLAAFLNGELDIASTAIHIAADEGLGINLDTAELQGVEVSSELMQAADVVLEGGAVTRVSREVAQARLRRGVVIPLAQRQAADRHHLDELHCTDEMIAEQQAQLDAAGA